MSFPEEFLRGQADCKKGIPHKEGMSEAYNRGYAAQYELEQVQDYLTARENRGGQYGTFSAR